MITKVSSSINSTKSSPIRGQLQKSSPYLTVHGNRLSSLDEQEPKTVKHGLDKKSKFWFMKPGALNGALNTTSPYHTIQLGSQLPPPSSTKGKCTGCSTDIASSLKLTLQSLGQDICKRTTYL